MRLVQTLVVRDEADIVDAQIAYHLNAGVDFVIATDHESVDGTTEILEAHARAGHLLRIAEQGEVREARWRTQMARLAATEYGADWVINTDADEFWMPRWGTLKETFDAIPADFGVVWALSRHFVPRPDDDALFAERMTARLSSSSAINDPTSPYRPHLKAAHRADPEITVGFGSHTVFTRRWTALHHWHPAEVLHFPFRSLEQWERKGVRRARGDKPLGQYVKALHASEQGRAADRYRSLVIGEATLARGLAQGSLVLDTRLRDRLRALEDGGAAGRSGTLAPDATVIAESSGAREADLVRVARHLDSLRSRLPALDGRGRHPANQPRSGSEPARREARRNRASLGSAPMKIVSILVCRDDADIVDAHLAFHLNAGVDFVLAADLGPEDGTAAVLESYERAGHVRRVTGEGGSTEGTLRTRMARLAVAEHEADWVLSTDVDEFWWPRGESLQDVLAAIPQRYGVVQGLVRVFQPRRGEGFFADRMTARASLTGSIDTQEPLPFSLRPAYRADPGLVVDPVDGTEGGRRVPLRAWYPIEVLRFPFRSLGQAERRCEHGNPRSTLEADAIDASREGRLAEWYASRAGDGAALVTDERLRDALSELAASERSESARRFVLPTEAARPLRLRAPDVVDDASYAGECAAVGEVDIERLEREIVELEGRITWLEERFWPRVLRQLSRLVPR